uniref:Cyclin T1 n=1 Tax=Denticeps clupeoides TaxID=299321 RepID=A0AAY4BDG8_9TELE
IHLACKWSNWEIPVSTDSKHWWEYVDTTVTLELLDELTHEFLQILEKTPSRLKRIRNWKVNLTPVAAPFLLRMFTVLSAPSTGSSSALDGKDRPLGPSGTQHWQPGAKPAGTDQLPQPNHEMHAPARVSLNEYRAKHAESLAAQKRKLENMEASVKREYALASRALIGQQRKEKHHHNTSPIILKIPLDERKMRFPLPETAGGEGGVRIRIPERRGGSGGEESKSRDKHRERSNHHHHHHHHHSSSSSSAGSFSSSSSSSSSHKHSSSSAAAMASTKKPSGESTSSSSSRISSSSSSRKRQHVQDPSAAGSSSHPPKASKSSRNSYQLPSLPSLTHGLDPLPPLGLPHHPGGYSHGKADKSDTNGHGAPASGGQSNEFQDTFDMLNSLLSAQGVQPSHPQMFDYRSQYGDYRYAGGPRGGGSRPPPLPMEPPPPLPPLPK